MDGQKSLTIMESQPLTSEIEALDDPAPLLQTQKKATPKKGRASLIAALFSSKKSASGPKAGKAAPNSGSQYKPTAGAAQDQPAPAITDLTRIEDQKQQPAPAPEPTSSSSNWGLADAPMQVALSPNPTTEPPPTSPATPSQAASGLTTEQAPQTTPPASAQYPPSKLVVTDGLPSNKSPYSQSPSISYSPNTRSTVDQLTKMVVADWLPPSPNMPSIPESSTPAHLPPVHTRPIAALQPQLSAGSSSSVPATPPATPASATGASLAPTATPTNDPFSGPSEMQKLEAMLKALPTSSSADRPSPFASAPLQIPLPSLSPESSLQNLAPRVPSSTASIQGSSPMDPSLETAESQSSWIVMDFASTEYTPQPSLPTTPLSSLRSETFEPPPPTSALPKPEVPLSLDALQAAQQNTPQTTLTPRSLIASPTSSTTPSPRDPTHTPLLPNISSENSLSTNAPSETMSIPQPISSPPASPLDPSPALTASPSLPTTPSDTASLSSLPTSPMLSPNPQTPSPTVSSHAINPSPQTPLTSTPSPTTSTSAPRSLSAAHLGIIPEDSLLDESHDASSIASDSHSVRSRASESRLHDLAVDTVPLDEISLRIKAPRTPRRSMSPSGTPTASSTSSHPSSPQFRISSPPPAPHAHPTSPIGAFIPPVSPSQSTNFSTTPQPAAMRRLEQELAQKLQSPSFQPTSPAATSPAATTTSPSSFASPVPPTPTPSLATPLNPSPATSLIPTASTELRTSPFLTPTTHPKLTPPPGDLQAYHPALARLLPNGSGTPPADPLQTPSQEMHTPAAPSLELTYLSPFAWTQDPTSHHSTSSLGSLKRAFSGILLVDTPLPEAPSHRRSATWPSGLSPFLPPAALVSTICNKLAHLLNPTAPQPGLNGTTTPQAAEQPTATAADRPGDNIPQAAGKAGGKAGDSTLQAFSKAGGQGPDHSPQDALEHLLEVAGTTAGGPDIAPLLQAPRSRASLAQLILSRVQADTLVNNQPQVEALIEQRLEPIVASSLTDWAAAQWAATSSLAHPATIYAAHQRSVSAHHGPLDPTTTPTTFFLRQLSSHLPQHLPPQLSDNPPCLPNKTPHEQALLQQRDPTARTSSDTTARTPSDTRRSGAPLALTQWSGHSTKALEPSHSQPHLAPSLPLDAATLHDDQDETTLMMDTNRQKAKAKAKAGHQQPGGGWFACYTCFRP